MSITLGLYDVFSYGIPGIFYLYLINETLRLAGWKYIGFAQLTQGGDAAPNALVILLLGISAFITGHIFEAIRSTLFDRLLYFGSRDKALKDMKMRLSNSGIEIKFHFDEWTVYQEMLQIRNPQTAVEQERLKSVAFMLRNLAFGAFIFALLQVVEFLMSANSPGRLAVSGLALLAAYFLHKRSKRFDEWFFRTVYTQALVYGKSMREVMENVTPTWKAEADSVEPAVKSQGAAQKNTKSSRKPA